MISVLIRRDTVVFEIILKVVTNVFLRETVVSCSDVMIIIAEVTMRILKGYRCKVSWLR